MKRRPPAPPPADAPRPATPPSPQRYRLEIQPEAPDRPWSAALVSCADGVRAEFTSPLALLRFISRSTLAAPRGGLR